MARGSPVRRMKPRTTPKRTVEAQTEGRRPVPATPGASPRRSGRGRGAGGPVPKRAHESRNWASTINGSQPYPWTIPRWTIWPDMAPAKAKVSEASKQASGRRANWRSSR